MNTKAWCVVLVLAGWVASGHSVFAAPPPAPAWVSATYIYYNEVSVTWASVPGATKYRIYINNIPYCGCNRADERTGTSFTDRCVEWGTTQHYDVAAVNASNEEGPTTRGSVSIPWRAPYNGPSVTAAWQDSSDQVKIEWKGEDGATYYEVMRSTSCSSGYSKIREVSVPTPSEYGCLSRRYTEYDTPPGCDTTYYYQVRAVNPGGGTALSCSNADDVYVPCDVPPPPPDETPPDLSLPCNPPSCSGGTGLVSFAWSATDNVTSSSDIEYCFRLNGGSWSAWSGSKSKTYSGLADGPYSFEVQARDEALNTSPSESCAFTIDCVPEQYSLAITVSGSGSTTPPVGTHTYTEGEVVSLSATPSPGWVFVCWSGAASGSQGPQSITLNGNKSVTAHFARETCSYSLSISTSGSGTVSKSPNKGSYDCDESVTLRALPSPDWEFSHWSGDVAGSRSTKSMTMDGDKSVTAWFELVPPETHTLLVRVAGDGTTNPIPGVYEHDEGTVIAILAEPSQGWRFDHWSGAVTGSDNPISVTLEDDVEVTAHFREFVNATDCEKLGHCLDEGVFCTCDRETQFCSVQAVAFSGLADFILDMIKYFYKAEEGVWNATGGACHELAPWAGPLCDLLGGGAVGVATPIALIAATMASTLEYATGFIGLDAVKTWGARLKGQWVCPADGAYQAVYAFQFDREVSYVFFAPLIINGLLYEEADMTFTVRDANGDVVHSETWKPIDKLFAGIMVDAWYNPMSDDLYGHSDKFVAHKDDVFDFELTMSVTYTTMPGFAEEIAKRVIEGAAELGAMLPAPSAGITTLLQGNIKYLFVGRSAN
jgi:hypothetical protein